MKLILILLLTLTILVLLVKYNKENFTLNVLSNKCSDYIENQFGKKFTSYTNPQQSVIGDMWRATVPSYTMDNKISDDIGGCVIPTQILQQYSISDPSSSDPCSFKDENSKDIMPNGSKLIPVGKNTNSPNIEQNGCMLPFMNDIIPNDDQNGVFNTIIAKAYMNKEISTAKQIKEAQDQTDLLSKETDRIMADNKNKTSRLQKYNTENVQLNTHIDNNQRIIEKNSFAIKQNNDNLASLNLSISKNKKSRYDINRNSQIRMVLDIKYSNKPIIQKKMSDGNWYTLIMKYTYGMSKQTNFNNDPFLLYDNAYGTNINVDQVTGSSPDMFILDNTLQYRNNPLLDILMASFSGVNGDSRVIMETYNDTDRERISAIEFMHYTYNDYHNWWNAQNLNTSDGVSETTITSLLSDAKNCNFFGGIQGDTNFTRRWFINRNYTGCANDPGYFCIPYNANMPACWDTGYRGKIITARDNPINFGGNNLNPQTIPNYHLGTKMLMWMRKDSIKNDPFQDLSDNGNLRFVDSISYTLPLQINNNDRDCGVSDWSQWTSCDPQGMQSRTRSIIRKKSGGGADCPDLSETRLCPPQDCVVSDWGPWSGCDINNIQKSNRTVVQQPRFGGASCPSLTQTRNCTVDCIVGPWGTWSGCDNGKSTQTQTRSIIKPPANGGAPCPSLSQTQNCPQAKLYVDNNYKGKTSSIFPGDYNWIVNAGIPNDSLSSMQIPNGYYITLYKNINFSGSSQTFRGNVASLSGGWNDVTSSFKFHPG